MSLSAKLLKVIRAAARARRRWEQTNIYYTKSEAAVRMTEVERERAWALTQMRDS